MVIFSVSGIPAPQGSKIRTRYGMREASKRVGPWREAVMNAVQGMDQLVPPYEVEIHFFIPRPRTTKAEFPVAPSVGDGDKLTRSTWDGLVKGGLLVDDRHVVRWSGSKQWAGVDGPGAVIKVVAA